MKLKSKNNIKDNPIIKELIFRELARRQFYYFIKYINNQYIFKDFHKSLIDIYQAFIDNKIKKLMISLPPQHGKSLLTSIYLPAFLICQNPNLKIAIVSYSFMAARKFSLEIQRLLMSNEIRLLFDNIKLSGQINRKDKKFIQTQEEFEIVNYKGSIKCIGRGGALTGNKIDVLIMDDLYKDYMEANSPVIRENIIDWFKTVANTRLNNEGRQIFIFTRWHQDDLIGYLEKKGVVIELKKRKQLNGDIDKKYYLKLNIPAISNIESKENEFDKRDPGVALWEEMHSLERLFELKEIDNEKFECLYQGNPKPLTGLLYQKGFKTYNILPSLLQKRMYIDVADTGQDFFCAISYGIGEDGFIYVLDVIYTLESFETTEELIINNIKQFNITECDIESNGAGRLFAKNLREKLKNTCLINDFYQNENKESRLLTNASNVQNFILFPLNWDLKYKEFANEILNFKKLIKANKHDDGADALTGVYEKGIEVLKQVNPFIFKKIDDLIKW